MSFIHNEFAPAVLDNLRHLRATTVTGIGWVLPERDLIGRCLQNYVDSATKSQIDAGQVRINPLGDANSIIAKYV
jgi:hypothetical protein